MAKKNKENRVDEHQDNNGSNKLGIDYGSLGELTANDLKSKKTAEMVLHYLASLEQDNAELKTTNETLKTYGNAYDTQRSKAKIAAVLSIFAIIAIGFGINILTEDITNVGGIVLVLIGVALEIYSVYLSSKSQ